MERKSCAVEINARGAFTVERNLRCYAGTTGESSEIDAMIVDGEDRVRVVGHGLGGFDFGRPGAVARVIGGGDDVSIFFSSGFERVDRAIAACRGIEGVDDGPLFCGRVRRRQVERVGLIGLRSANAVKVNLAGDGRNRFLLRRCERTDDEDDREEAMHL